jgi:Zn-dependent protease
MGTFAAPMAINFRQVTAAAGDMSAIGGLGEAGGLASAFAMLLSLFFSMNLLLFLLNMIPFPPLDGASALPLILPESWALRYQEFAQNPMFALIGLILMWNLIGEIFYPVFYAAVGLLYPGVTYG